MNKPEKQEKEKKEEYVIIDKEYLRIGLKRIRYIM